MVQFETIIKDCVALTDAELGDMADLSQRRGAGWEAGLLSKQVDDWVLNTQLFRGAEMVGFCFSTLERIGGTPAMLFGPAFVDSDEGEGGLAELMRAQFHKARMAFPDEDVVCALRAVHAGSYAPLARLTDVRPWPETRLNGEERAWGRRLAKRFGVDSFDDRTGVASSSSDALVFDSGVAGPEAALINFECVAAEDGHLLICWGWALAEFLDEFADLDA